MSWQHSVSVCAMSTAYFSDCYPLAPLSPQILSLITQSVYFLNKIDFSTILRHNNMTGGNLLIESWRTLQIRKQTSQSASAGSHQTRAPHHLSSWSHLFLDRTTASFFLPSCPTHIPHSRSLQAHARPAPSLKTFLKTFLKLAQPP